MNKEFDKKLSDWIKQSEKVGYSEEQLKDYLLKKGYKEKDVRNAIGLTHKKATREKPKFSLLDYISRVPVSFFLFILSFIFLSHSFGKSFEGNIILIAYLSCLIIVHFLYRINKVLLSNIITISAVSILLINSFLVKVWFAFLILNLGLLHTLIYFFSSKRKYQLEPLLVTFITSATLAVTITILTYLLFAFKISEYFSIINDLNILIIMFMFILLFSVSYFLISTFLLEKTNSFNFQAYSVLNKLLGSNIFQDKNWKKRIIILIYALILSMLLFSTALVIVVNTVNSGVRIKNAINRYQAESRSQRGLFFYDGYLQLVSLRGFNNIINYNIGPSKETMRKRLNIQYYPLNKDDATKNLSVILYNCSINLSCQKKRINQNLSLEKQLPNNSFINQIVAKNKTEKVLFVLPLISYDNMSSLNLFFAGDKTLRNTKIASELNKQWQEDDNNNLTNEIKIPPSSKLKRAEYFYSGKEYKDLSKIAQARISRTSSRYVVGTGRRVAIQEYYWIKKNQKENVSFYDGTKNLREHIKKLKDDVNKLYSKFKEIDTEKINKGQGVNTDNLLKSNVLFYKASNKLLINHTELFKEMKKTYGESFIPATKIYAELIEEEYEKINTSESSISKAIRLKIIEELLAKEIIEECHTFKCFNLTINLTKDPELCKEFFLAYSQNKDLDKCIMTYSAYDKSSCSSIFNETLKRECFNES